MSNTSPTKTIAINPEFFKVSKPKKQRKKKNLEKLLKPNNIKKKLIARIKEHQKKKEKEENNNNKDNDNNFANELQDSIQYLESVTNKIKKEKMQKNIEKKKRKEKDNDNFSPIIDLKQENWTMRGWGVCFSSCLPLAGIPQEQRLSPVPSPCAAH